MGQNVPIIAPYPRAGRRTGVHEETAVILHSLESARARGWVRMAKGSMTSDLRMCVPGYQNVNVQLSRDRVQRVEISCWDGLVPVDHADANGRMRHGYRQRERALEVRKSERAREYTHTFERTSS